jgi:hypothetical protein
MRLTLKVYRVPASNQTALLLVGIFMNPCMFGAGGSFHSHYSTTAPSFKTKYPAFRATTVAFLRMCVKYRLARICSSYIC